MIDVLMSLSTNSVICVINFSLLCVIHFCFVICDWMPDVDFMLMMFILFLFV